MFYLQFGLIVDKPLLLLYKPTNQIPTVITTKRDREKETQKGKKSRIVDNPLLLLYKPTNQIPTVTTTKRDKEIEKQKEKKVEL